MPSCSTIKKVAASTAIASSLALGGLGLAAGIAAAAPADHSTAGPSTSSSVEAHGTATTPTRTITSDPGQAFPRDHPIPVQHG
jgi:hypothetical protein